MDATSSQQDKKTDEASFIDNQLINQENSKENSPKAVIWILGLTTILATIAATIFAYLFFSEQSKPKPTSDASPEIIEPAEPEDTEVEITDTYILRDLDNKIAILHDRKETTPLFMIGGINYIMVLPLYQNKMDEIAKLVHVAKSIVPDYYLSNIEIQSAIEEQNYDEKTADYFRTNIKRGIKGETLSAKYLDVFGESLVKGATNGERYCPMYYYNSTYDFYYDPVLGCGGTGPYTGYYYKNRYTLDNNHAYVYVSTATLNGENGKVYCDIIDTETFSETPPAVCGEASNSSEFTINNDNYQNLAQYRFVFNKADNGTYYFSKVEKL